MQHLAEVWHNEHIQEIPVQSVLLLEYQWLLFFWYNHISWNKGTWYPRSSVNLWPLWATEAKRVVPSASQVTVLQLMPVFPLSLSASERLLGHWQQYPRMVSVMPLSLWLGDSKWSLGIRQVNFGRFGLGVSLFSLKWWNTWQKQGTGYSQQAGKGRRQVVLYSLGPQTMGW